MLKFLNNKIKNAYVSTNISGFNAARSGDLATGQFLHSGISHRIPVEKTKITTMQIGALILNYYEIITSC